MEEPVYQAQDAIGMGFHAAMLTGGAGLMVSAVQNSLTKQNVGAMGVFTRFGSTTTAFAAMGGVYEFVRRAAANLREKEDSWNPAIGGFFAGATTGLRARTLPAILGYGVGAAILLGVYDYTGGSLAGFPSDPEQDEFARKQHLRKNRRRPIEETIQELGEGRGVYGPGYQERRSARLKARYNIDVQSDSS